MRAISIIVGITMLIPVQISAQVTDDIPTGFEGMSVEEFENLSIEEFVARSSGPVAKLTEQEMKARDLNNDILDHQLCGVPSDALNNETLIGQYAIDMGPGTMVMSGFAHPFPHTLLIGEISMVDGRLQLSSDSGHLRIVFHPFDEVENFYLETDIPDSGNPRGEYWEYGDVTDLNDLQNLWVDCDEGQTLPHIAGIGSGSWTSADGHIPDAAVTMMVHGENEFGIYALGSMVSTNSSPSLVLTTRITLTPLDPEITKEIDENDDFTMDED